MFGAARDTLASSIALLYERDHHKIYGNHSFWEPMIAILPQTFDTPKFWPDEDLKLTEYLKFWLLKIPVRGRWGSVRGPREVRSGSVRGPLGVRSGSVRGPFWIRFVGPVERGTGKLTW